MHDTPSSIADACEALGGDLCFGSEWDVTKRTNGKSTLKVMVRSSHDVEQRTELCLMISVVVSHAYERHSACEAISNCTLWKNLVAFLTLCSRHVRLCGPCGRIILFFWLLELSCECLREVVLIWALKPDEETARQKHRHREPEMCRGRQVRDPPEDMRKAACL